MKRFAILLMSIALLAFLAACNKEEEVPTDAELPEPIEVELTVPEHADPNEAVKLSALVTQGDEKVEDASEVEYEIWEEGKKDDSIHIEATNEKEGVYSTETSFETAGTYHVQVHVTARSMHVMPEKQIVIGHMEEEHDADHHDHGSADGVAVHFMEPEDVKVDEETELMTHVQQDGKALEETHVRYEITNSKGEVEWVESDEVQPGEYVANYTFTQPGTYQVKIHIKDENIHEHEEHEVEVK